MTAGLALGIVRTLILVLTLVIAIAYRAWCGNELFIADDPHVDRNSRRILWGGIGIYVLIAGYQVFYALWAVTG